MPPFRKYVRNEGRRQIKKRLLGEKQTAPTMELISWNGRKLQAQDIPSPAQKRNPKKTIDSMSKDEIAKMLSEVSLGLKKVNQTAVDPKDDIKPTFQEFLEFVLSTDLRGICQIITKI